MDEGDDEAGEMECKPSSSVLEKPCDCPECLVDDAVGCLGEDVLREEGVEDNGPDEHPGYDLVD